MGFEYKTIKSGDLGPELQCLLKVKEYLIFQHAILDAKNCLDRYSILVVKGIIEINRKKRNYFDFKQFETLLFAS